MVPGIVPVALLICSLFLLFKAIRDKKNDNGSVFFLSLFTAISITSAVFAASGKITPLFLLASQATGSIIFISMMIVLLRFTESPGIFVEGTQDSGKIAKVTIVGILIVGLIDYLPLTFGDATKCRPLRCLITDILFGSNQLFQSYYMLNVGGVFFLSFSTIGIMKFIKIKSQRAQ